MVAPSKRNCRIAQRIARTPKRARGAHTFSLCSRNVTVWQVCSRHIQRRLCHRIRAGTPAQGASITSTTIRPWPCAITPQPGHPASCLHDSTSSTRASGVRATLIRWKPSKPTSRSHRSQRSSDAEQQQVGRDIVEVLDDSGGRSPLIIKDLDLYPQPPLNTRSPTLNSEEPLNEVSTTTA